KARIIKLQRGDKKWKDGFSKKVLQENDVLTVEAPGESLFNLESEPGVEVLVEDLHKKAKPEETLQMIIPQNSRFIGKKVG
ncbi:MAG: hypothetical protein GTO54_03540, partial [Nitrososphaeria archaeon]|nr:hypothetical protein [Nitrososphaeria archaeon]